MFDENSRNLRLYVKRVFINDKFEDLMPRWLKFVRGVVDSNDLPLNVSREILQKSKVLSIINKRLVRKSLDMMRELAEGTKDEVSGELDTSQYTVFWNNFGKYLKVGVIEDDQNRKDIAPLLRFFSSKSGEEYTSLDEYVSKMPEDQKAIYYVTGDGRENVGMSPVIEKLAARGYDVLYATEPLDEIMFQSLRSYSEKDIVDAAKENLQLPEDEDSKKKKEEMQEKFSHVIDYLQTLLSDKIEKVKISTELSDSPAALVQGAYGMSPTMQRYMRAQAVSGDADMSMLNGMNKVVLEINPNHAIVKDLDRMVKADKEAAELEEFAMLLYDVASMTSGYDIPNVKNFAQRVLSLMDNQVAGKLSEEAEEDGVTTMTSTSSSTDESDTTASEDKNEGESEAITPEVL
jgi:heat shock protein beta